MLRIFTESNSSTAGSGIIRLKEIVNRLDFLGTIGSSFTSYLIFIVCETGQCLSTLSMATTICKFSEKVREKVGNKEENNNNESLVCDVCSVVCKSNANLRKHKQRTHDDREYACDTCGIKVTGLEILQWKSSKVTRGDMRHSHVQTVMKTFICKQLSVLHLHINNKRSTICCAALEHVLLD